MKTFMAKAFATSSQIYFQQSPVIYELFRSQIFMLSFLTAVTGSNNSLDMGCNIR